MITRGLHVVWWDGTDESGAPVSNGVYPVRIQSGTAVMSGKMYKIPE
jgi:flagellar hook assembly protein FlgD